MTFTATQAFICLGRLPTQYYCKIMDYFTNSQQNCSSFTLGFENKSFDEAQYVKKIEKTLNKEIYYASDQDIKSNFLKLSK